MTEILGVSFSDEEIKEFQEKLRTFNSLKWIYEKNRKHQEISDKEAEKELGRFGLYVLRMLASIGYLSVDIGSDVTLKQNKSSIFDRVKHFASKIKEFCR